MMEQWTKRAEKIRRLASAAPKIARSAVGAGASVMAVAVKRASPGTVADEIGFSVRSDGERATAKAGLMQFATGKDQRGASRPHGLFLDHGTKYVQARHFISKALMSSKAAALKVMRRTARSKVRAIIGQ